MENKDDVKGVHDRTGCDPPVIYKQVRSTKPYNTPVCQVVLVSLKRIHPGKVPSLLSSVTGVLSRRPRDTGGEYGLW